MAIGPRRGPTGLKLASKVIGTAVSEHGPDAWLRAVVEAVERYCFAWPHDPSSVLRASFDQVAEWAVPLSRFGLLTEEERGGSAPVVRQPKDSDEIDWTWAYSLTRRRFALVPAVMAFASVPPLPPNDFVRDTLSTGMATHVSPDAAVLSGLYEVVERDALMIAWLNARSPRQIVVEPAGPVGALIHAAFDLPDLQFHLLDVTSDCRLPTIVCLATSDSLDHPAAVMGAATRASPPEAARKALLEAAQSLFGCHTSGWTGETTLSEADVHTLDDHAHYYAGSRNVRALRFLLDSSDRVPLSDLAPAPMGPTGRLQTYVDRLRDLELEVLAVDLTTADVGRCGLSTFKVMVPGAVDLNTDVRFQHLGSARIRQVPRALGWPDAGERLNLAPCPLS